MKNFIFLPLLLLTFASSALSQDAVGLCAVHTIEGEDVVLDILVDNFEDIISFQFAVAWNSNDYELVSHGNYHPELIAIAEDNFGPVINDPQTNVSHVKTLWFSAGLTADLVDGESLFTFFLRKRTDNASSDFGIIGEDEFVIEVVNSNVDILDVNVSGPGCGALGTTTTSVENTISQSLSDFHISPNPTSGPINIAFDQAFTGRIEILRIDGRKVDETIVSKQAYIEMDLAKLLSGPYFVRVVSQDGIKMTKKVIKTK